MRSSIRFLAVLSLLLCLRISIAFATTGHRLAQRGLAL